MGGHTYRDVTELLRSAAKDLQLGELVHSPGLTLMDAMCAIHIGDTRMDSYLPNVPRPADLPPFSTNAPLLPHEITYILDVTTQLELLFHDGAHLTQSLYTSLYLHRLQSISLENLKLAALSLSSAETEGAEGYAWEWVGLVLRAGLMGCLVCVGAAWAEMAKGTVYDAEDFHSDKSGLALGEQYSLPDVLALLSSAIDWLSSLPPSPTTSALLARLRLRSYLIHLLHPPLPSLPSAAAALDLLPSLGPAPAPTPRARAAFDPYVAGKLPNNAPLPPVEVDIEGKEVWMGWRGFLEGVEKLREVGTVEDPSEWLNWLSYRSIVTPSNPPPPAIIRNLTMSLLLSEDNLLLHKHPQQWLVDSVVHSMTGIPRGTLTLAIEADAAEPQGEVTLARAVDVWCQRFTGFYVNLLSVYCHNRPRQKRNLGKAIRQWEDLIEEAADLVVPLDDLFTSQLRVPLPSLALLPSVPRLLALGLYLEILLSGLELDLYDPAEEWLAIYWHAARVARVWGTALVAQRDALHALGVRDEGVGKYLEERIAWVRVVEVMADATLRALILHPPSPVPHTVARSLAQARASFERRFKWAIRGLPHGELEPRWDAFQADVSRLRESTMLDETAPLLYNSARTELERLLEVPLRDGKMELAGSDRVKTLAAFKNTCLNNMHTLRREVASQGKWTARWHPWFPAWVVEEDARE